MKKSYYTYWMSSLLLLSSYFNSNAHSSELYASWTISAGPTYDSYKFNVLHHFTGIAPYFETNADGLSPDPPQGCTVDKAIYQVRHGSIYVNENDYVSTIEPFLLRLKNLSKYISFQKMADLAFLSNWTSPITNSGEQVAEVSKLGFLEAFSFGTRLAYRYPDLLPVNKNASFKVWASDSNRTRHSAEALFSGLYIGHETIGRIVVVSEGKDRGADTLAPTKTCPRFDISRGTRQTDTWLKHYTVPIIARLNAMVSGFQFSPYDVLAMQELCGYETIIRGSSPFCKVFTPEEWLSFEYYFDIKYYYELGYGGGLSPTLGMPWLVATSHLLSHTNTNDQHLFIGIAHRQLPPLILTGLGLYNDSICYDTSNMSYGLPLDRLHYDRKWKSSEFISFLSNIALERLNCRSNAYNGSFVRVLINSTPKPLPKCTSGPGGSCPLDQYIDYVNYRNSLYEVFSKVCDINYKYVPDSLSIFEED